MKNKGYAKVWGQTKCTMGDVQMANLQNSRTAVAFARWILLLFSRSKIIMCAVNESSLCLAVFY